jgi:SAM-dependent methyltransferase
MPRAEHVTPQEAQDFYEDFSLAVGLRDWLTPNLRHEHLKRLVDDHVGATGLRLLDVGCGAGVMTEHLTRYGTVIGTDFSTAAIRAAQRLVPGATFSAGRDLPAGEFDVICLFDVLEHIPRDDRPAFLAALASRLGPDGRLIMSTPHPAFTRTRRAAGDASLQIIDEEVEVADVVRESGEAELRLIAYRAFDVFDGSPEYQAMVFMPAKPSGPGRPVVLRDHRVAAPGRRRHRLRHAARAARRGDRGLARWFLRGRPPKIVS